MCDSCQYDYPQPLWSYSAGNESTYFPCCTSKRPQHVTDQPQQMTVFCMSYPANHSQNSVFKWNIKSTGILQQKSWFQLFIFLSSTCWTKDVLTFQKHCPFKAFHLSSHANNPNHITYGYTLKHQTGRTRLSFCCKSPARAALTRNKTKKKEKNNST